MAESSTPQHRHGRLRTWTFGGRPWALALLLAGASCDAFTGIDGLRFAQGAGASCESTSDCAGSLYCDLAVQQCLPRLPLGATCESSSSCQSARCEGGFCCDGPCGGACVSCALPSTRGSCEAVLAGDDPKGACPGTAACGEGGVCQGALRWAVQLGDANDQEVTTLAVAPGTAGLRDVVVAGTFAGSLTLGPFQLAATGLRDVFVARIGGDGRPLWARALGADDAQPTSAAFDAGMIYIAGSFSNRLTIETEHLADGQDGFVFALDPGGNHRWTTIVGGPGDQGVADLSLDGPRLALVGDHDGPLSIGADIIPGGGGRDAWLAILATDGGTLEEATSYGDAEDQAGVAVALDGATLAMAVDGAGTIDLGAGPVGAASGDVDAVVANLDATTLLPRWALRIGGAPSTQRLVDLALAPDGTVWATGWTDGDVQSTFAFDHTTGRDALILRLDAGTGSPLAIPLVGTGDVVPTTVSVTDEGALVVGRFHDRLEVGEASFDTTGDADGFVVELADDGSLRWATTFGGPLDDAIAAADDDASDLLVAGSFEHRLDGIDPPLRAEGERDGFLARMAR